MKESGIVRRKKRTVRCWKPVMVLMFTAAVFLSACAPAHSQDPLQTSALSDQPAGKEAETKADSAMEAGSSSHSLITDTVYKPVKKADVFEGIVPDRYGDAGLLLIPEAGINVRLFKGSGESGEYNQHGTDFEDSAGLFNWGGGNIIADHENQGFTAIRTCIPYQTKAYVVQEDHSYVDYLCTEVMEGTNDGMHLYGSDGHDYMNDPSGDCDLVMYTCLEDWQHIIIVLWEEAE